MIKCCFAVRRFVHNVVDVNYAGEKAGLMPWAPCWMAFGIGIWFWLPFQPGMFANGLAAVIGLCGVAAWYMWPDYLFTSVRLIGFAALLGSAGFGLTSLRALRVEAPALSFHYYGPVEGRIVGVSRSDRDRIRLTLDRVRLEQVSVLHVPYKVRISLSDDAAFVPLPGTRVMLTAHLGPLPGPSEPGGFDFRRFAWFDRLGAVGYTRSPVMIVSPPKSGEALWLHRLRMQLSGSIQKRIAGQEGAIAAALMTGDRSGISEATNQIMRDSNLFHIISISGLHMGMLAGFIYTAIRFLVTVFQAMTCHGHTFPAHKLAALAAILVAGAYLCMSDGGVATERAFIMVAAMLGAILVDRRALSLRTVALAALIIFAIAPESLLTPGFQMSFAATVALIVVYPPLLHFGRMLPWLLRPIVMLILSSLVAGAVTSPIAAAHFNRMAHYGVLANLLAVPITGILIMPMGPVAAVLALFGLEAPALWIMGLGVKWMIMVGGWVAELDGAVSYISQPDPITIPMMGFGATIILLCWGRAGSLWHRLCRFSGALLLAVSGIVWVNTERPRLLISQDGDVVGLMKEEGRSMSRKRGGAFTAGKWLEKDGDGADQAEAASRKGWTGPKQERRASLYGVEILHLTGKGAAEAAVKSCQRGRVIILNQIVGDVTGNCRLFDKNRLKKSGAVAARYRLGKLEWISTAEISGQRPWVR